MTAGSDRLQALVLARMAVEGVHGERAAREVGHTVMVLEAWGLVCLGGVLVVQHLHEDVALQGRACSASQPGSLRRSCCQHGAAWSCRSSRILLAAESVSNHPLQLVRFLSLQIQPSPCAPVIQHQTVLHKARKWHSQLSAKVKGLSRPRLAQRPGCGRSGPLS